jgi:membrane protein YqaA with SNARE-associated domain
MAAGMPDRVSVKVFAATVFTLVLKFGGVGLLVLGILDSSFLFAPWGNDLLLVAMTARRPTPAHMLYYAAMSTAGSVLGCWLIDITLRPLGAAGLERHLAKRRIARIRQKIEKNAGSALAIASFAPPPFPFTAFVMGAAALQYPRDRLLTVIGVTRMARFVAIGLLALRFGPRILKWAENPMVQGFLIGLIVLCTIGSIVSVYGWVRRSRI